MELSKISSEQTLAVKDVINYLEELTRSFKEGKVVVKQGDDFVNLDIAETVAVEVEGKNKKDKAKFSLELSWRKEAAEALAEISIDSKIPEKTASTATDSSATAVKAPKPAPKSKATPAKSATVPAKKPAATPALKPAPKAAEKPAAKPVASKTSPVSETKTKTAGSAGGAKK